MSKEGALVQICTCPFSPISIKGGPKPPNIGGPDGLVEKFETQIYSTWTFASQAQLFQI